jgi:hypothetical protein
MKKTFLTIALLIVGISSYSQNDVSPHNVSTTIPENTRFEIVQSNLAARLTFKVDKYSGDVYQLASTTNDGQSWSKMKRLDHVSDNITDRNKVNYQLVTSGIALKFTYLMNVDTGATWELTTDKSGNYLWDPQ